MAKVQRFTPSRSGLTLIELLVVVAILILLTAAALPALGPAIRGQQVRDGTRALTAFLAAARARAAERGRPVGILLERFGAGAPGMSGDPTLLQFAANVYLCEAPQPYAGDSLVCKVVVQKTSPFEAVIAAAQGSRSPFSDGSMRWLGLLRSGDLIQFQYQGPWYRLVDRQPNPSDSQRLLREPTQSAPWYVESLDPTDRRVLPWLAVNSFSPPLPFQIMRQPVKSAAEVRQLPGACVIDLQCSGQQVDDQWSKTGDEYPYCTFSADQPKAEASGKWSSVDATAPVLLLFAPDGSLLRIYYGAGYSLRPSEPVFLLVGRREKVQGRNSLSRVASQANARLEDATQAYNYLDPESRWIAIDHQTGKVTVAGANVGAPLTSAAMSSSATTHPLAVSRQLAREGKVPLGGRQ